MTNTETHVPLFVITYRPRLLWVRQACELRAYGDQRFRQCGVGRYQGGRRGDRGQGAFYPWRCSRRREVHAMGYRIQDPPCLASCFEHDFFEKKIAKHSRHLYPMTNVSRRDLCNDFMYQCQVRNAIIFSTKDRVVEQAFRDRGAVAAALFGSYFRILHSSSLMIWYVISIFLLV